MSQASRLITMKRLRGQCALITGANSGIGEAIAKAPAVEGAQVVVNYVTNEPDAGGLCGKLETARERNLVSLSRIFK